jgi:hypothetical protein
MKVIKLKNYQVVTRKHTNIKIKSKVCLFLIISVGEAQRKKGLKV